MDKRCYDCGKALTGDQVEILSRLYDAFVNSISEGNRFVDALWDDLVDCSGPPEVFADEGGVILCPTCIGVHVGTILGVA